MTKSRELANYCQESVKSIQSKKTSESPNNFYLNSLDDDDQLFFEFNNINFDNQLKSDNQLIYKKVIDYIVTHLTESNT